MRNPSIERKRSPPKPNMSTTHFRTRKTSSPTRYPSSHSLNGYFPNGNNNEVGDGVARKRTSKKDEAIRKKAESNLAKKNSRRNSRPIPCNKNGTVSSLKPSQALTVRETTLVVAASQLMAAKRADCVLVIDEEEQLSGIFTAKDLAFRVVGDGLDAKTTTVKQIMTTDPMCVRSDTSATDALNTMVKKGFRHLPVCNEDGDVVGLLDITKCLYEALEKMERAYGSSKKLYDALEGVEKEWSSGQVSPIMQYMSVLREKMACPDLTSVLDGSVPAEVGLKTTVRDAARMMRQFRTTAVLVMENNMIAGIFTSKDIVLRVIAAGLDPSTCSVVRVMTPHPDTAPPMTSILQALKKMHDGHYLNLPVVEGTTIIGMMYSMQNQENGGSDNGSGPMWNKFWNSVNGENGDDNDSVISDSLAPSQSASNIPPASPNMRNNSVRNSGNVSPVPEIHPGESASVIDDNSAVSFPHCHAENFFTFKFKAPNGKSHRFTVNYLSLDNIRSTVLSKLPSSVKDFTISYVDDDEDHVTISTEDDVLDAVKIAQRQNSSKVILFINEIKENRKSINTNKRKRKSQLFVNKGDDDFNLTIPKDLLLPGALVTLAIIIVGVFAISRK
ncbi:9573_t:CDS:2 [Entrophospora sp. SA101]|nr:9573_t:CDS:2 [Entrophospora sp. SA101]